MGRKISAHVVEWPSRGSSLCHIIYAPFRWKSLKIKTKVEFKPKSFIFIWVHVSGQIKFFSHKYKEGKQNKKDWKRVVNLVLLNPPLFFFHVYLKWKVIGYDMMRYDLGLYNCVMIRFDLIWNNPTWFKMIWIFLKSFEIIWLVKHLYVLLWINKSLIW